MSSDALAGWLSVHLALAGGVSLLILGAAQFFACAILATAAQPSRLAALQAGSWSLDVVAVAVARTVGQAWLAPVDVMLSGAALLMFRRESAEHAATLPSTRDLGASLLLHVRRLRRRGHRRESPRLAAAPLPDRPARADARVR